MICIGDGPLFTIASHYFISEFLSLKPRISSRTLVYLLWSYTRRQCLQGFISISIKESRISGQITNKDVGTFCKETLVADFFRLSSYCVLT